MARVGTARVDDVLDYERDIKGKRLIRLSAGVGAGKNYWAVQVSKKYPELKILLITSRINTAKTQAKKMEADGWFVLDRLLDDEIELSLLNLNRQNKVVCTNARIGSFMKNQYNKDDERTHLWKKFDLVILDEAHSMTTDAVFAEASFHIESFIRKVLNENNNCDVVMMSGTMEPIEWFFNSLDGISVHNIDCFEKCLHIEPDKVFFVPSAGVIRRMTNLYKQGERIVYFSNFVNSLPNIINELKGEGVLLEHIGVSFAAANEDRRLGKFPKIITDKIDRIDESIINEESLPDDVKILFTTSKNKEGISLENDDVKVMFAESSIHSDLVQMAGRVRGNKQTGTGIRDLYVIHDAKQHNTGYSFHHVVLSDNCLAGINEAAAELIKKAERRGDFFNRKKYDSVLDKSFNKYVNFDYLENIYRIFTGKIEGQRQAKADMEELRLAVDNLNEAVFEDGLHGYEKLMEWFPFSSIMCMRSVKEDSLQMASSGLEMYLRKHNLLDVEIDEKQREFVSQGIKRLVDSYGAKHLGIKRNFKTLKIALKKLGFDIVPCKNRKNSENTWVISKL